MAAKIIVKKKGGHGGHHGGAWKVAYADFVTAMMALFIVLWLLNTSKKVQEAVGGYFRDPSGTSKLIGGGVPGGTGGVVELSKDNMPQLKETLEKAMHRVPNFEHLSKQIEMTVTAEGLRVELLESEKGTFFDVGSATPSESAKELLTALAQEIGKLPNHVSIEGHTDSRLYGSETYSNWELSVDRANAARRIMCENGLGPHQVAQVRGYADQQLRHPDAPEDPRNRRISLIVGYLDSDNKATPENGKDAAPSASVGGKEEKPAPPQQAKIGLAGDPASSEKVAEKLEKPGAVVVKH
jgi:chemotaxis protein MotB